MNNKEIFSKIYLNGEWIGGPNNTPLSGPGSSLWYTEKLRAAFPGIMKQFNVKTLFDAGCGDLTWISTVVNDLDINYIGADIVGFLVEENKKKFPSLDLRVLDITVDSLPYADMMICRDCMFHMSFADIHKTLNNFLKSKTPFLFATSHKTLTENIDIVTGDFTEIDLLKSPFCLPEPIFSIDNSKFLFEKRTEYIWTREQIENSLKINK